MTNKEFTEKMTSMEDMRDALLESAYSIICRMADSKYLDDEFKPELNLFINAKEMYDQIYIEPTEK